jgi:hypothetical protein
MTFSSPLFSHCSYVVVIYIATNHVVATHIIVIPFCATTHVATTLLATALYFVFFLICDSFSVQQFGIGIVGL